MIYLKIMLLNINLNLIKMLNMLYINNYPKITESKFIKVYYCNARTICNKLPMLISLPNSNIYDILIFTET